MSEEGQQTQEVEEKQGAQPAPTPRLMARFQEELLPELMELLGVTNKHAVPKLDKVVLNIGVGNARDDENLLKEAQSVLQSVSGQAPVVTRARKSVAGFGIRSGDPIGCKVTLRHRRMYEFLDRLISIVLPRVRDFRGLSANSFDGTGNYTLGIDEHFAFPEIDPDALDNVFGMDITICTTADADPEAFELLSLLGVPFQES